MSTEAERQEKATDRLVFRPDPDSAETTYMAGWKGPWPPPEHMNVVVGKSGWSAYDPEDMSELQRDSLAQAISLGYEVHPYRRYSASTVEDPAPPDENWFRGALYVPED